MAKTSKPLTILTIGLIGIDPIILALREQGHQVDHDLDSQGLLPLHQYDLILGPTCARFLPGMEDYLSQFVKGARALKDWSKVIKHKGKKDD